MGVGKVDAFFGKPIECRGRDFRIWIVGLNITKTHVVRKDHHDIWKVVLGGNILSPSEGAQQNKQEQACVWLRH